MKWLILFSIYLIQSVFSEIISVKRAEDTGSKRTGVLFEIKDKLDLFLSSGKFLYDNKAYKFSSIEGDDSKCEQNTQCIVTFSFTLEELKELDRMKIEIKTSDIDPRTKYWKISQADLIYNKDQRLSLNVDHYTAPKDYSFSCSSLELSPAHGQQKDKDKMHENFQKIFLHDFQLQPFKSSKIFNESYDCSSWFTIGSFMGLIIILMFTTVLAFGICFILNIKTNDRFEDPKGKPLVLGSIDG